MREVESKRLPGPIDAIAVSPDGDRIAVATRTDGAKTEAPPHADLTLHVFRIEGTLLVADRTLLLHGDDDAQGSSDDEVKHEYTRIAFRDDRTVIVARMTKHYGPQSSERVEIFAVDLETGQQRGRFLDEDCASHISGLIMASPKHVLLGIRNNVICLDAKSFVEVCRLRQMDESGDPEEEDAIPEETLAPDGFTYDAKRRLLYMLCGYYDGGALSCYRFYSGRKEFERKWRRDVCETRPEKGLDLPATCGLCLHPNGKDVTAVFKLENVQLDSRGRPVEDLPSAETEAGNRKSRRKVPPLKTAWLGWLGVFHNKTDDWIEFHSDLERDFEGGAVYDESPDGEELCVGYQLLSSEEWQAKPVHVDDDRVVIGSPSGLLLLVDVATGRSTIEHDVQASIGDLHFCRRRRWLFVGGQDGTLTVLEIEEATKPKGSKRPRKTAYKTIVRPSQAKPRVEEPPLVVARSVFSMSPVDPFETQVAITPDGRLAAAGSFVWEVDRRWNVACCAAGLVGGIVLSADGRYLLSNSQIAKLCYWDVTRGRRVKQVSAGDGYGQAALSVDGTRAAVGSYDKVEICDLESGRSLFNLEGHTDWVHGIAFNRDGRRLASGSTDQTVRIWDLETRACLATLSGHSDGVAAVAWVGNGPQVASASWDGTLRVWDTDTARCLRVLEGHTGRVDCLALTPDGTRAVSGSGDFTVRVWDLPTGQCTATLSGHQSSVASVAVAANGIALSASGSRSIPGEGEIPHEIRLWDITTSQCLGTVGKEWYGVFDPVLSRDGRLLITRAFGNFQVKMVETESGEAEAKFCDCTVRVWDIETRGCLNAFHFQAEDKGGAGSLQAGDMSADGRVIMCESPDATLWVWDATNGTCLAHLEGHPISGMDDDSKGTSCLALSEDGRLAVTGGRDKTCRIWDIAGSRCLATLEGHTDMVRCIAISADASHVASGSPDATVRVWEVATGSCVATLRGHNKVVRGVVLSRDGRLVVSGAYDGTVRIWEVATGRCLRVIEGPSGEPIFNVAISADGSLIAGANDFRTRIWDPATGRALAQYRHPRQSGYGEMAFRTDGRTLVNVMGITVGVWPLPEVEPAPE